MLWVFLYLLMILSIFVDEYQLYATCDLKPSGRYVANDLHKAGGNENAFSAWIAT
jgi:hypothetical protein